MGNNGLEWPLTRQQPDLACELLMEDTLVLVSTTPRQVSKQWQPDYVFVDWGAEFRAAHNLAYPETRAPRLSVGLSMIGLDYILEYVGSGYLSELTVEPLIRQGRLHRVRKAPTFQRPLYLLYPNEPIDGDLLSLAMRHLKEVVANETEFAAGPG